MFSVPRWCNWPLLSPSVTTDLPSWFHPPAISYWLWPYWKHSNNEINLFLLVQCIKFVLLKLINACHDQGKGKTIHWSTFAIAFVTCSWNLISKMLISRIIPGPGNMSKNVLSVINLYSQIQSAIQQITIHAYYYTCTHNQSGMCNQSFFLYQTNVTTVKLYCRHVAYIYNTRVTVLKQSLSWWK